MKRVLIPLLWIIGAVFATSNIARADACPHAPAPRLREGLAAVVAPGIDGLNLRTLPAVDTGIITRLYAGNPLTVISGPSCNRAINWWRVELPGGVRGWVAEGTWEAYWVIPADEAERPVDPYEWTCHRLRRMVCPSV